MATATADRADDRMISPAELAQLLGVELRTVYDWHRRRVNTPPRYAVGGQVRYRMSEVLAWVDAQRVQD